MKLAIGLVLLLGLAMAQQLAPPDMIKAAGTIASVATDEVKKIEQGTEHPRDEEQMEMGMARELHKRKGCCNEPECPTCLRGPDCVEEFSYYVAPPVAPITFSKKY